MDIHYIQSFFCETVKLQTQWNFEQLLIKHLKITLNEIIPWEIKKKDDEPSWLFDAVETNSRLKNTNAIRRRSVDGKSAVTTSTLDGIQARNDGTLQHFDKFNQQMALHLKTHLPSS